MSCTEYHHLKFVSQGGKSKRNNVVALCSNCHSKIHNEERAKNMDKKKGINNDDKKGKNNNLFGGTSWINPLTGKKEKLKLF